MHLSRRLSTLPPSGTLSVGEKVRALREQGRWISNLSGGAPDPDLLGALRVPTVVASENTLGHARGEPNLREAFARRLASVHGVCRSWAEEMIVTIGAKQGLYFALLGILEPGDEVVIIDPCWVTYAPSISLAGGKAILVPLGEGNALDISAIDAAVTSRTRAIILNTPHNPTGRVLTRAELALVADLVLQKSLWLICDESFDLFVFDENVHVSPGTFDTIREQTILLYSFSKAFAMPCYRIGIMVGPRSLCQLVANCTQHLISSISLGSQKAALKALKVEPDWAPRLRNAYREKRDVCIELLRQDRRIRLSPPQGTFYLFPDISAIGQSSDDLTARLLDRAGVAVTSGTAFGGAGEGHIRINLVGPLPTIIDGMKRLLAELPA